MLLSVGLAQVLEIYCEASLQSQHSSRFPTQAWDIVTEKKDELQKLSVQWTWGTEDLVYTDIEAPSKVLFFLNISSLTFSNIFF